MDILKITKMHKNVLPAVNIIPKLMLTNAVSGVSIKKKFSYNENRSKMYIKSVRIKKIILLQRIL